MPSLSVYSVCANAEAPAPPDTVTAISEIQPEPPMAGPSSEPNGIQTNLAVSSKTKQAHSATTSRKGRKGTRAIPAAISPKYVVFHFRG
jgi:hypothetical protein